MTKIEKLYSLAGVEKHKTHHKDYEDWFWAYPPFTAEKQLHLENFLLEDSEDKTFTQFEMLKTIENKFLYVYRFSKNNSSLKRFDTIGETRQECLAGLINSLWQDLTEAERNEIREILK